MKRRQFMAASAVGAVAAAAPAWAADEPAKRELYELRTYSLAAAKQAVLDRYLEKALIPAAQRLGAGPVGVFTETTPEQALKVYVLIVHPSGESFATFAARLAGDADHRKAGAEYLDAKAADPVYARIESSLFTAIETMPKLEKPDTSKPRLLNLRIYEAHNERANDKKIEMFDKGELGIFRRVGLTPVFFGKAIAGTAMPNLTYLLSFPDEAGRTAAWNRFRGDAEWLKMKAMPEYADKEIVSKITNRVLAPTAYSQI